jgi:hypothetical protein
MRRLAIIILGSLLIAGNAWAQTFQVEHDHFWRSCTGKLIFGETTVEFVAEKKKEHSRLWKYGDIQQLAIVPGRISIVTYDARRIELGADQSFNFKLLSGTLSDQFRREVEKKLTHPLVSGIVPEQIKARFSIPARHRLFLDDSQGMIEFGEEDIVYRSDRPGDSRIWHYDELLSMGSTGPFQLRLGALQKTGGEYGEERNYVFDLKRRMTSEEYDFIWEKINRKK